jgi:methionyl-tRNA synthetase
MNSKRNKVITTKLKRNEVCKMRQILIGGAWPYANGSLHIGHIAGLLPGDVLARYHRAIGDKVYFVSGSDCHGTPVAIRAKQENKTP